MEPSGAPTQPCNALIHGTKRAAVVVMIAEHEIHRAAAAIAGLVVRTRAGAIIGVDGCLDEQRLDVGDLSGMVRALLLQAGLLSLVLAAGPPASFRRY
jgi:hypothetical protein